MFGTITRFTERAITRGRVDREQGIIYGVKVLGRTSRNNREYTERAMRDAVSLYDGTKVFVNHPTRDRMGDDRSFHDWVGVLRNPQYREGGIYADIHLRTKSPLADQVAEAAEKFAGHLGMSHIAAGSSRGEGSRELVDEILEVLSVDIVMDPATVDGFFESVQHTKKAQQEIDELREIVHDFRDNALRLLGVALERGETSMLVDAIDVSQKIGQQLVAWINAAETGYGNDQQVADETQRIVDALAGVFREPLTADASTQVGSALDSLVDLVDRLAAGEEDSEIVPRDDEPFDLDASIEPAAVHESVGIFFSGKPRRVAFDEGERFAHRLR